MIIQWQPDINHCNKAIETIWLQIYSASMDLEESKFAWWVSMWDNLQKRKKNLLIKKNIATLCSGRTERCAHVFSFSFKRASILFSHRIARYRPMTYNIDIILYYYSSYNIPYCRRELSQDILLFDVME